MKPFLIVALLVAAPAAAQSHLKLVEQVDARVNPPHTIEGAFEVTKRVAWQLRGEGFGLLLKPSGDNIVDWNGKSYSASRICVLASGRTVKVLSDVPTTAAPTWQEEGVPPADQSCTTALDPEDGTPPTPPAGLDLSGVPAQIAAMAAELHEHVRADGEAHAALHNDATAADAKADAFYADVRSWKADVLTFVAKYGSILVGMYETCRLSGKCGS